MKFAEGSAIYIQIAEYVVDNIIRGDWKTGDRLPSVREMATDIQVNPNTVARTYAMLSQMDIIHNTRGIGYFVSDKARKVALDHKKEEFYEHELPRIFQQMNLLDLDFDQIKKLYNEYKKT